MKFLGFLFSMVVMAGLIGSIIHWIRQQDAAEKLEIRAHPGFVQGVVARKRSYKGKGMSIDYWVLHRKHRLNTGVNDSIFRQYEVGDSIPLCYSLTDPSKARILYKDTIF